MKSKRRNSHTKFLIRNILGLFVLLAALISCSQDTKLPYLGIPTVENGQEVPHQIKPFSFTNHNGQTVTEKDFEDKIYIADFFYATCPTICPTVMSNMIKMHDKYLNDDRVVLLSHTLDPKKDTIEALKAYANNLEIDAPKWHLVTGDKKQIREFAEYYMTIVIDDPEIPGGINHSGKILLVDKDRRIRSFADGTDAVDVERFMKDIEKLLKEYE